MDVDPTELCLGNHSIKGTISATLAEIVETLDFAKRGEHGHPQRQIVEKLTNFAGKLRLEPNVVGLSKWNEAIQTLKHGQVAGYVVEAGFRNIY